MSRRTASSDARGDRARYANQKPTPLARRSGAPSHGWFSSSDVSAVKWGGRTATETAVATKITLSTTCKAVGGVSGRPKQPQVERGPPRLFACTTVQRNNVYDTATRAAVTGRGKTSAQAPSAASMRAAILVARRVKLKDRTREILPGSRRTSARAVSSGRTALATPASTRRPQAMKKMPISSIVGRRLHSGLTRG